MVSKGRRAGIYVRISQDREGREVGIKRQEEDCRALAERNGWEVVEVYSDNDASATSGKRRKDWERLLKDLDAGTVNAVLAYSSSRMYRRLANLAPLLELAKTKGIQISTVASGEINLDTADGRMLANILTSVDQAEVEKMGERIARDKLQARDEGRYHGGGRRPYGYRHDPENGLTIDETQAAIVREAAQRVIAGETVNRVAVDLNTRGVVTSGGLRWRPAHLRRLLISPFHAGIVAHDGSELGPGEWPAILTTDEHRILVARLAGKSETGERLGARKNVLSGLVSCAKCGSRMYGSSGMYRCSARDGGCNKVSVSAQRLESFVYSEVIAHGDRIIREAVAGQVTAEQADDSETLAAIATLEGEKDDIAASLGDGKLSLRLAEKASARIEKRLEQLRVELAAPRTSEPRSREERVRLILDLAARLDQGGELSPAEVLAISAALERTISEIRVGPGPRMADLDSRVSIEWVS
jgi:site-specific DNA recombinase